MTLGASWNAGLDTPTDSAEVDAQLDRAKQDEFLKAIERDSTIADRVIGDAAKVVESGVLKRVPLVAITPEAGTLTVRVEREIVRAMAEARAAAAIPAGAKVPGLGYTSDGLVFEVTGGRKRPTFVSVNVATGKTHRVIKRRGRYLVQAINGKTLGNVDNLALALLLLALLEKERRDAEERKRQAEAGRQPNGAPVAGA